MTSMHAQDLIGRVAAATLRDELGEEADGGTARFLLDGLGIAQTAAVASAVLADPHLAQRVEVKLPRALFADAGLPSEALTDRNATFYRSAECPKAAYLVTNAAGQGEQAEEMSLHELTPVGAAQLLERVPAWVGTAAAGLGLDEDARTWWERALSGLHQLGATSLDRFARYVLAVRRAVEVEGHPLVPALGVAMHVLHLPSDASAFSGLKDAHRRHASAWRREYAALRKRRRAYLIKEGPNQLVLREDELVTAFGKARDAIPERLHGTVQAFVVSGPGWNASAEALAKCPWEEVKPLFEGLARERFNLGADTLRFLAEGDPGLLSADDRAYLERLAKRKAAVAEADDLLFHERWRDEVRHDRKLKSAWDKFVYGRPRETDDFLAGLAACMETLVARAAPGVERRLRIRCEAATKRDLRALNTEAGLHFAFRYAGLPGLLGPEVTWEVGSLFDYPAVLAGWRRDKDKAASNRSTSKPALQLRFQLELETQDREGGVTTASAQLFWRHRLDVISSQMVDDWGRLEEHPFLLGRASREPAVQGRRAGGIDLSDVRTLVPAYDRDRGSLLPTYRRDRDLRRRWIGDLGRAEASGSVGREAAAELREAFDTFAADYEAAVTGFRTHGPGGRACREQARSYARLLDGTRRLAPGDRNRGLLLQPLLDLGQASVLDGPAATIVAPWHPLRLAAMWRKAQLVREVVRLAIDFAPGLDGDTKLFFADLATDLADPFYPEVVATSSGCRPELLALVDHQGDYSLHEAPVMGSGRAPEVNDDPDAGAGCLLDLVERYLTLHPHERSNLSVVLFNCDSARLPRKVVEGLEGMRDEADVRCSVMLRHTEPVRLREMYRSILAADDGGSDAFSASEATQDFMARLRIGVIAERAAPPDPRDGRPYDVVFSQDVVSRHASVEWYGEVARPADLEDLLPARWSRRRPVAADDLRSCAYLCCPVQSHEGWSHLSAVTSCLKGEVATEEGRRLLPVRQLDFRDERTARLLDEMHDMGAWVVNHDELLNRRQLQNQGVRVIRYKKSATQGRNVVISSRAPLVLLATMVRRRLEDLQLGLSADRLSSLCDRLVADANEVSGDIVLRAAKRGEAAGEMIGVVLSRFLAQSAIGRDRLVGWYFLDDYAAWLGAREETMADVLALSPSLDRDGVLRLSIVVTEAKYVDVASLSAKHKESERQLRDTVRRIRDVVSEQGRFDRESWLSRLGDLLLDGIQVPAADPVPLADWRRLVREGACRVSVTGFSHVFVPTAGDGPSVSDAGLVPNAPGCRQETYGRADLRALLLAYVDGADPMPVRRSLDPLCASGLTEDVARGATVREAAPAALEARTTTSPAVEPSTVGTDQVGPSAGASAGERATSTIDTPPSGAALPPQPTRPMDGGGRGRDVAEDNGWLDEVATSARAALQQLGMRAKPVAMRLTPNAAVLRFAGSAQLTVEQVARRRSELLTTHGLNVLSVRGEPGVVALHVARRSRRIVDARQVWERWAPRPSDTGNQDLVVGVQEEDDELFVFSPGGRHAPHTLIAGSTGSGKSVLMQSILLGIAATNTVQQARVVLIDPKQGVDYFAFDDLPHLDGGIIDERTAAAERLEALVAEMDRRYEAFKGRRVRDLAAYNAKVDPAERLPTYWVVHDEFAEWMMVDDYRDAVTATVGRLGVKARAAGIHLIFAAQRPDSNVVPVQLRSQLGNRLILRVDSEGTSEIALGERGAERLLGKGHMLVKAEGESGLVYVQVPFAEEAFIEGMVTSIRGRSMP